ncbi:MAG: ABC transporter ATP-binding protein [Tissierellia bacterium]|jgi:ABC-2 type transport system ATP-binding protein|nr:ABC transporter ATP-binding protein [Tissierellia bacterium]
MGIILKNIKKQYKENILYENLNMEIKSGEVFALIGPNGVGKTTLMRMILGWENDYQGEILMNEGDTIGYSPEIPDFPKILTGREVLEFFMEVRGMDRNSIKEMSLKLLETVGLEDSKTKVKNYSKGMKQRLAVAQSLIGDPDILLLDEPSAGLDFFGQVQMQELISNLKSNDKTILLNSHLLYDVEKVCDRGIIIMENGVYRDFQKSDFEKTSLGDMFLELAKEDRNESFNKIAS